MRAPTLHLHSLGVIIGVHKTSATCCGKRVKFAHLAITQDADCSECRAHADQLHAAATSIVATADQVGMRVDPAMRARLLDGPTYRNAIVNLR